MSKKLSVVQSKQLEVQKGLLLKQLEDFNKLEKPTEVQLKEAERIKAEISKIDIMLAEEEDEAEAEVEAEITNPMVVDMSEEAKAYKVPKGEENHVHIRMFTGARFDPLTGKETANYTIQKFNAADFKNFEKQASRLGYRYGFMHKPANFKSIFNKK